MNVRGVTPEVPRPTPDQLCPQHASAGQRRDKLHRFQNREAGKGDVVTGWKFTSNEEVSPHHEYCYYSELIQDGIAAHSISPPMGGLSERRGS